MRIAFISISCLLALRNVSLQAAGEVEKFECQSTDGWLLTDFAGGKPESATLSLAAKSIQLRYDRRILSPLVHYVLLTELRELRVTLASESGGLFLLAVQDRDGAGFHFPFELKAGKVATVRARPEAFKLNDDSKVHKPRLDPARLSMGYVILDASAVAGGGGPNTLRVSGVEVERAAIAKKSGDLKVEKTTVISESMEREGDLIVGKGALLRITAPRFILRGNVRVEGTLEISGGLLVVPQRFNHERKLAFSGDSTFSVKDATVVSSVPLTLALQDRAAFVAVRSEFQGGVTCEARGKTRVALDKVVTPGEFIVAPGAEVSVADCKSVLLWLTLGEAARGELKLPPGNRIEEWTAGLGLNLKVRNSTQIMWGVLAMPGCDCTVKDSEVMAAGLYFGGDTAVSFKDIKNRSEAPEVVLPCPDRKLRFVNCGVGAWNFYAGDNARVRLERCVFGEALVFGKAKIEARDSVCDGSGGYLGVEGQGELFLSGCQAQCVVVAREKGLIALENCTVAGNLNAAGKSTIRLINTKVRGKLEKDSGARIVTEEKK